MQHWGAEYMMVAPFPTEGDPGPTPGVPIGFPNYLFSLKCTCLGKSLMGVFNELYNFFPFRDNI